MTIYGKHMTSIILSGENSFLSVQVQDQDFSLTTFKQNSNRNPKHKTLTGKKKSKWDQN